MKKLVLLLLLSIPLVALGQDYRRVSVYDESGNDLGTYMIQSDYTSSVNMAIDKYIRYLEERESRQAAEQQKQKLQNRLKELGMPSYLKSTAAIEGYNLARYGNVNGRSAANQSSNRQNSNNSSGKRTNSTRTTTEKKKTNYSTPFGDDLPLTNKRRVTQEEYNYLVRRYNILKKQYETLMENDGKLYSRNPKDCDGDGVVSMKEMVDGCK